MNKKAVYPVCAKTTGVSLWMKGKYQKKSREANPMEQKYNKRKRGDLYTIFAIIATQLIGFGLIIPVMPQIALDFGATGTMMGFLLGAYSLAQFIATPIWGSLSDKYGRKPILIISQIATVISFIILAVANNFWLLLISRLIDGFGGGSVATARAYVADITTEEDRPKGMAMVGIAFGLGFILGPAVGGLIYGGKEQYFIAAMVVCGLTLIALLMTIFMLKESKKPTPSQEKQINTKSFFHMLLNKYVAIILFIQFFYMVVIASFQTTFAVFTDRILNFSTAKNSWLFMYMGFIAIIVQGLMPRFRKYNPAGLIKIGFVLIAAGIAVINLKENLYSILIGLPIQAIGSGLILVYLPTILSSSCEKQAEGEIMGLYEGVGSLSRVIGPLIAGSFILTYTHETYWGITIAALLAVFIPFARRPRLPAGRH